MCHRFEALSAFDNLPEQLVPHKDYVRLDVSGFEKLETGSIRFYAYPHLLFIIKEALKLGISTHTHPLDFSYDPKILAWSWYNRPMPQVRQWQYMEPSDHLIQCPNCRSYFTPQQALIG